MQYKPEINILIVEDEPNLRILLELMCKRASKTCHTARNAKEAYFAFDNYLYEYILLDIKLNGDNGVDICARLREVEIENKQDKSYIMAHTALAQLVHQADLTVAGFDEILEKPTGYERMIEVLCGPV